jgi:hypothetical protein
VRMPGLSGIELCKEILRIDEYIHVVLISALKPVKLSKLFEIVDSKLNR